jgi:hypothetical protein
MVRRVEEDRAADDVRVAVKPLLPERVAEDDGFRRARLVVAGLKHAAYSRTRTEHGKEAVGDIGRDDPLRLASARETQRLTAVEHRERVERLVAFPPREKIGVRQRVRLAVRTADVELDQTIRFCKRQRPQQDPGRFRSIRTAWRAS